MYFLKFKVGLALIFVMLFSSGLLAQEKTHTVGKGETIFSIALAFDVDRNDLMKLNGITDPTKLQAGQKLRIPDSGNAVIDLSPAKSSAQDFFYSAVRGDTLYGIAKKFDVPVNDIFSANSLSPDYMLKQGDVLRIPGIQGQPAVLSPVPAQSAAVVPAPAVNVPLVSPKSELLTSIPDPSVRWPVMARELNYMTGGSSGVIVTGLKSEPVKSLTSGTVISAGPYRGYGRVAIVQAPGGYIYVYGGCDTLNVKEGDKVGPGMEMGRLGIDPITEKPQLFLRVYQNNIPVDPAKAPRA